MNTTFHVTPGSIQIVRGLLMSGLSLGMLGFVLSLLGMECTFIGGKDRSKHKKIYAGGCCHITSGNVYFKRTFSKDLCRTRQYYWSPLALSLHWSVVFVSLWLYVWIFCCVFSSGFLAASGYAVYAQHVSAEYFNPNFDGLKWVNKPKLVFVPGKNDSEKNFMAAGTPTGLTWAPRCSSAGWARPFTWLGGFSTCGRCVRPSVDKKKGESIAFIERDM